jgi:hypothetical protein
MLFATNQPVIDDVSESVEIGLEQGANDDECTLLVGCSGSEKRISPVAGVSVGDS